MSRSFLHDKDILKQMYIARPVGKNPHKLDEMPKNKVSKYVSIHGGSYASWMEDTPSYGGHRRQQAGHRMVSGIVRANVKEETRRQIKDFISLERL